ncbi:MAG: EpsG family protein [Clostridia bacterium]|nr:EpsG family protein [Clostridia bacterium]
MWNIIFFAMLVTSVAGYIQKHDAPGMVKTMHIVRTEKLCMFIVCLCFILFVGLRTWYNDTTLYTKEAWQFTKTTIDWSFDNVFRDAYFGFTVYITLIKKYINNAQWLLMLSSIITNLAFLIFYRRHSRTFAFTVLSFILVGPFLLTCAALKQVIAMAIALIGVNKFLQGDKKALYISLVFAYTFHPYIIVLGVMPFLISDKVWDGKMWTIVIFALMASVSLSQVLGFLLNITEGMSKTYTAEELLDHTINPLRVIVEACPVILSFMLRHIINAKHDRVMNLGVNMMVISFLFTFASLFGNPIYIYRMGNYFCFMNAIVIPWMLTECMQHDKRRDITVTMFFVLYFIVFAYDLCGMNFNSNIFNHTSIMSLFK